MIAPFGMRPLPHPRDGVYRRADLGREQAERLHRASLARRDAAIARCPRCGGWVAHPQPGEPGYRELRNDRRPARHVCPPVHRLQVPLLMADSEVQQRHRRVEIHRELRRRRRQVTRERANVGRAA